MPTAEQVTARLRELARLSQERRPAPRVDMSAAAVTARLRELADLSRLCAQLARLGQAARTQGPEFVVGPRRGG